MDVNSTIYHILLDEMLTLTPATFIEFIFVANTTDAEREREREQVANVMWPTRITYFDSRRSGIRVYWLKLNLVAQHFRAKIHQSFQTDDDDDDDDADDDGNIDDQQRLQK